MRCTVAAPAVFAAFLSSLVEAGMLKQKEIEKQHDDSKKSHPALALLAG
jgi:hypothetical protein